MAKWTKKDHVAALKEGWILSNDSKDKIAIAKVDDPQAWPEFEAGIISYKRPKFKWDETAVEFVKKQAKKGAKHAIKALAMVGKPAYPKGLSTRH